MAIKIVENKISEEELKKFTHPDSDTMVKIAVDVKQGILSLGCVWHSECQQALINNNNSSGLDVWGANIHLDEPKNERLEYDSLINIKPALKHKEMKLQNEDIKDPLVRIYQKS